MIELCKINRLKVVREAPQGLYLAEEGDAAVAGEKSVGSRNGKGERAPAAKFTGKTEDVLLPGIEVPEGVKPGDELDVFIYLDSSDRYTATLRTPGICLDNIAFLKVVQVTDVGVFLDWGLEKNLLLPFKEVVTPLYYDPVRGDNEKKSLSNDHLSAADHTGKNAGKDTKEKPGRNIKSESGRKNRGLDDDELAWLEEGRELPVVLYIDRSGRPAASMRVYDRLRVGDIYETDSAVEARVIQINPRMGVFVAVDDRYYGMINIKEIVKCVNVGDRLFGRISGVRDDGKYMVSLTQKAHLQMDNDAQAVLGKIKEAGGVLPLGDKSGADEIMRELGMSKKAFKRAVGQLYKEGKVVPGNERTELRQ